MAGLCVTLGTFIYEKLHILLSKGFFCCCLFGWRLACLQEILCLCFNLRDSTDILRFHTKTGFGFLQIKNEKEAKSGEKKKKPTLLVINTISEQHQACSVKIATFRHNYSEPH